VTLLDRAGTYSRSHVCHLYDVFPAGFQAASPYGFLCLTSLRLRSWIVR